MLFFSGIKCHRLLFFKARYFWILWVQRDIKLESGMYGHIRLDVINDYMWMFMKETVINMDKEMSRALYSCGIKIIKKKKKTAYSELKRRSIETVLN